MDKGTKLTITNHANGSMELRNDETTITVQADGTVAISTTAPLQLTGACLAKLDYNQDIGADANCNVSDVLRWLARRLEKKR
jgi:hypothetical protein